MKKIHILLILALVITAGLFSCDDNEDFSSMHVLTDDEIAEIARQDSIAEAQKNMINADLILEYSMNMTISGTSYDGGTVEIELDKIAEAFGITEEELLAGIGGESGAPEVKGFAIDGSTHNDVASAKNTNAPWGHWWDAEGDVVDYGDNAMVFAEFYPENAYFNVGQFPGHLVDGQQIKFVEGLKYNEVRVAVVITVNAAAAGAVVADVVSEQDITVDVTPKSVYDAQPVDFDLDAVLSDLGISSMDEVTFLGVNADGSYAQEAETGNGFWYNADGFVTTYSTGDQTVYTNYGDFEANQISLGQMPDVVTEGMNFTIKYGFMVNSKIVMLNLTVNAIGYIDPETTPEGDPVNATIDAQLSKEYTDDYASVSFDVQETLRQAFKMTTYQIHMALASGDMKVYQGEITDSVTYTADAPGYWLGADGSAVPYAEGIVWTSLGHSETALYLYGGNHPANAVAGDEVTTTYIVEYMGTTVTINLTFSILADSYVDPETAPAGDPEDLTATIALSKAYSDDYVPVSSDVKETLRQAFKMTTYQIHKAMQDGTLKLYQGEVTEADPAYTATGVGYWLNADGTAVGYAEGVVYCTLEHNETELFISAGNHPENAAAGDVVTTTYIATCNGGSVTFDITYTVE